MRIAILGTRGIPNNYGGFEQMAQYLSVYLVNKGFEVYVFNSHNHPFQENKYMGVNILHCYDPEYKIGTVGQFIYDLNCTLNCKKQKYDIVLQLGYTSSSIWNWLIPKKSTLITNMDGLEWKRSKFSGPTKRFLKFAEKIAVKRSDVLVADSIGIQNYLKQKFNLSSHYIAYGAEDFNTPNESILNNFNLNAYQYDLLIARFEPENNIEPIIEGYINSKTNKKLILIGNHEKTKFGQYLYNKYNKNSKLNFMGTIYDIELLNNLRYYSNVYFHGHSVGGTNPSLLEAMASNALIYANNNEFNKYVLEENAYYFNDAKDIANNLDKLSKTNSKEIDKINNNKSKIKEIFNWKKINSEYENLFMSTQKQ